MRWSGAPDKRAKVASPPRCFIRRTLTALRVGWRVSSSPDAFRRVREIYRFGYIGPEGDSVPSEVWEARRLRRRNGGPHVPQSSSLSERRYLRRSYREFDVGHGRIRSRCR